MRYSLFLVATLLVGAAQAQQQAPAEPSLADQARAAAKNKDTAKHAKLVADNDVIEEKKKGNGPFPELGPLPVDWAGVSAAANAKGEAIASKMAEFIATHPKDEAKRVISDWFAAEDQAVKDLKQRKEQLEKFAYTGPTSYDQSGRVYSAAAGIEHADNQGRDDIGRSLSHIEQQLSAVRDRGAKKGIPWSWMLPNEKDVRDKPIIF